MRWRDRRALGILMNTRGLMELIVLNIGLDLGVISPTLFTMMVIMALVTTAMTTPDAQCLSRRRAASQDQQEAERRRDAGADANRDRLADRHPPLSSVTRASCDQRHLHRPFRHARVLLHDDGSRRGLHQRAAQRRAVGALDAHLAARGQPLDVVGQHRRVLDAGCRRLRDPRPGREAQPVVTSAPQTQEQCRLTSSSPF